MNPKDLQRFISKVKKTDNCWIWTACLDSSGYGLFRLEGKTLLSHRISYELFKGYIPKGLQIDHLCRNRSCINPDHLEPVTQKENINRGISKHVTILRQKSKTHCPQGHEYTNENTKIQKSGRCCRKCCNLRCVVWREKTKK